MEGKRSRRRINESALSTANMVSTLFSIFIFLLCATKDVTTHRLNVPRVLLPVFNDFAINFTLEVTDGGCYQW